MTPDDSKLKVLLAGQDPSLPGGMAKYIGGLAEYLDAVPEIETYFFNETRVKGRAGMTSANPAAALRESLISLSAFRTALGRERPDTVHLHMAHGLSVLEKSLMAVISACHGVPALVHLHGAGLNEALPAMPAWKRRWLNKTLAPPNHVVVLSDQMQTLVRQYLPAVRTAVVPNAVALITPPAPLRLTPIFGFIGFMDKRKGECDLIDALADPSVPPVTLLLAGDGPARQEAEARASALGLTKRVRFLGSIDGIRKDRFFREIDVLCLPSYAENQPISLLEGMAYGRPVIATTVGAIPEMITDGIQGWLTPPGDILALAAALRDAACDPEEIRKRGQAAWQTVAECFTWERNGPKIAGLYRQLLHEHRERQDKDQR